MHRTLVTGFGPFHEVASNPSETLAQHLGTSFKILEVSYRAADLFVSTFDPAEFDILLLLGVAVTRSQISIELSATNLCSGADVLGQTREPIIEPHGPAELVSSLWTQELVHLLKLEHPSELSVSLDAGHFLCNYLYYQALRAFPQTRVGFLHVPLPEVVSVEQQLSTIRHVLKLVSA